MNLEIHKTFIKQAIVLLMISFALLSSCNDPVMEEITSIETSRLFSATDVEARIVNQTGVRLNWKPVDRATGYIVEIFVGTNPDFSGQPVRSFTDVTDEQLPYTVTGLDGETDYTARIAAVGSNVDNSKWITVEFTTDAEQIFLPVDLNELEATQVVLRWAAGEVATTIELNPGNIVHQVTEEEVNAGFATVVGLSPETEYTAVLKRDTRTRGTVSFTTPLDLGGAIALYPEDDVVALLEAAQDGDVFAVFPGEYMLDDIRITADLSIQAARPAERPLFKGAVFRVSNGASLTVNGVLLDGATAGDGNQLLIYGAGEYAALTIENCAIYNYVKGVIYINTAAKIDQLTISRNIMHDIECAGGDFIDFRNGIAARFDFVNNTVYRSALTRDFFRMDAGGSDNFPAVNSVISINNNTFYHICDGTNRRLLYIRLARNEIHFNQNMIARSTGYYTNQSATNLSAMRNNNYFEAPNFTASSQSNAKNDTGTYFSINPGFADPENGDFTVSNEELRYQRVGDTRWIP